MTPTQEEVEEVARAIEDKLRGFDIHVVWEVSLAAAHAATSTHMAEVRQNTLAEVEDLVRYWDGDQHMNEVADAISRLCDLPPRPRSRPPIHAIRGAEMSYILQRQISGVGNKGAWFDAEVFEDQKRALTMLQYARQQVQASIDARGGNNWTGERPQRIRLVTVVDGSQP